MVGLKIELEKLYYIAGFDRGRTHRCFTRNEMKFLRRRRLGEGDCGEEKNL